MSSKNVIQITYCTKCKWLARAAWYTQEVLSTFAAELDGVAVCPSDSAGQFTIDLNGEILMDRKVDGFLEAKHLKQRIRDKVAPTRTLGHSDRTD